MASELARLQAARKLLEARRELRDRLSAIDDEIEAVLGGQATIGDKLKRVTVAFDAAWGQRYAGGQTGRYVWNRTMEIPAIKRLLKTLTVEEIEARAVRYIADADSFFSQRRHPFMLFASAVNKYAEALAGETDFALEAPADCRHVPPCRSDLEHTKRRTSEMRA